MRELYLFTCLQPGKTHCTIDFYSSIGVDSTLVHVEKTNEKSLDSDVPMKVGPLILEDAGANSTTNNTDPTNNQIIHDLNDEKDQKNVIAGNQREVTTTQIINDKDEFGEPRLIQRVSHGRTVWSGNPLFKGSPTNSVGEETHIEYVKGGVRRLYPNRDFRKFV